MATKSVIRIAIKGDLPIDRKDLSAYGAAQEKITAVTDFIATTLGISNDDLEVSAIPTNVRVDEPAPAPAPVQKPKAVA